VANRIEFFGKYRRAKQQERVNKSQNGPVKRPAGKNGRDIIKQAEHRKIAPGHPNTGRR